MGGGVPEILLVILTDKEKKYIFKGKDSTITVKCMVRVRPLSKKEKDEGSDSIVMVAGNTIETRDNRFTFDAVFPEPSDQIEGKTRDTFQRILKIF